MFQDQHKLDIHILGDSCVTFSFGDCIEFATSSRVLRLYSLLKAAFYQDTSVYDIVPAYTELAVHHCPGKGNSNKVIKMVNRIILESEETADTVPTVPVRTIPVRYCGDDLDAVAATCGITIPEVIRLHTEPIYRVAMIGFLPDFPYLLGLNPSLETQRKSSPRQRVPAGSVAIAGLQAGIYPSQSPGGWNLLGITNPTLCQSLNPGDPVRFVEDC